MEFILRRGTTYAALGTCDEDCSDLDLGVLDGRKQLIGSDVEDSDYPTVSVTVQTSGAFYVRVVMAKCRVEPCRYAVSALAERVSPKSTSQSSPLHVTRVNLGDRINIDKTVPAVRTTFGV